MSIVVLAPVEQERLAQLEEQIGQGLQTFITVGTALAEVRNGRLYRQQHDTFEHYCEERWNLSRKRAYDLMAGAEVVRGLSPNGDIPLPANEAQARALAAVPFEERAEVLAEAAAAGPLTAASITETYTAKTTIAHPPKPAPAPPPSPRSPVAEAEPDTTCRGLCGTTAEDPSMVGGWCQTCLEEQNPSPRDLRPTALRKQAEAGDIDAMWKRVGALKKALREFPTVSEVMATLPHADSIESLDAVAEKAERLAMTWKQDRKANSGLRLVEEAR